MKKCLLTLAAFGLALCASAREYAVTGENDWYFGLGAGYHFSKLNYTNLDKDVYPENKFTGSSVFSVFARKGFGKNLNFLVRPEINVLNRGGKLTGIKGKDYTPQLPQMGEYRLNAHFVDLRLPLIYQFGNNSSKIRPYVYAAPILGFCTGGHISYEEGTVFPGFPGVTDYSGVRMDMSKSNMNSLLFAAAAGVGLNWYFNAGAHRCYLGLEGAYEHGFSNTYGKENEADYKVIVHPTGSGVEGKRRLQGLEVKLSVGIPMTVFGGGAKKTAEVDVEDVVIPIPPKVTVRTTDEEDDKPCYSLEEINTMIARGERVEGKTICAIDGIITFAFGKSEISPESYAYLNKMAETLNRINANVLVKGFTDNIGEEDFNMRLSRDRAIAVYNYLVQHGVPAAKLSYAFYGMSEPRASNDTPEGRQINRRVEFEILK